MLNGICGYAVIRGKDTQIKINLFLYRAEPRLALNSPLNIKSTLLLTQTAEFGEDIETEAFERNCLIPTNL